MNGLINAPFAEDVLFNGSVNKKIVEVLFGRLAGGFPRFRRDDSDHSVKVSIFIFSLSNKLEEVLELLFAGFQNWALVNFILSSKHLRICERKSVFRKARLKTNCLPLVESI